MGQCSTLPSEASHNTNNHGASSSLKARYRHGMTESSDNSATPLTAQHPQQHQQQTRGYHLQIQTESVQLPPRPQQTPNVPFGIVPQSQQQSQQYRQTHPNTCDMNTPQPMQEEREAAPTAMETAIRQRCYKLNLESEFVGIHSASTPRQEGQIFGPFADHPPPLTNTYSGSGDEDDDDDDDGADDGSRGPSGGRSSNHHSSTTRVAIQTAQIFRGITVAKDGTILSQNARATRSNRMAKNKRGEKSRQAAKIDQAKDLVDEAVSTGRIADDKEAHMVSLIIVGEYDEMKQLVRDGSKKLRDANGLPDETLLAVNRPRGTLSPVMSPSRKRVSPFALGSSHSVNSNPMSPTPKHRIVNNNAIPPKLKGHPRDPSRRSISSNNISNGVTPPTDDGGRQNSSRRGGFSPIHDPCHDMFGSSLGLTRGFNSIWNCGGNTASGTMNSTQHVKDSSKGYSSNNGGNNNGSIHNNTAIVSPQARKLVVEARHDSNFRGMRNSDRMEPPLSHHQTVVNA